MKNIALVLAALVGLILMDAREGSAGSKFETVTHVDKNPDGSGRAYGALGASRSSDNAVEFIGCQLIGVGSRLSGGCSATSPATAPARPWSLPRSPRSTAPWARARPRAASSSSCTAACAASAAARTT